MKRGFSLIETLLALIFGYILISMCVLYLDKLSINKVEHYNQDLISSIQLCNIFNLATNIEVEADNINFMYLNQEKTLYFTNNRLIIKPGTNIYFNKIEKFYFQEVDNKIYLYLTRFNQKHKFLIGVL